MNRTANLRQLHLGNVSSEKGKQQQKARHRDRNAGQKRKPVDGLLTGVEATGRGMFVLNEASALLEPLKIDFLRNVVLEEDHDDQDKTDHEGEAGEVVHVLGCLRDT